MSAVLTQWRERGLPALAPVRDGVSVDLCLPILPNQQDTRALAQVVSQRLRESPALGYLIAGHGLTTWGNTPAQARRHVEALEFLLACELSEACSVRRQ